MTTRAKFVLQAVKNMPEDLCFRRVGIVPYFRYKDETYFFLMTDSQFGDLTDCGGIPHRKENWIDASRRETSEESRNFFSFSRQYLLQKAFAVWREDLSISIIFIDVSKRFKTLESAMTICDLYRKDYLKGINNKDNKCKLENSHMGVYSSSELKEACIQKKVYLPVRRLLKNYISNLLLSPTT